MATSESQLSEENAEHPPRKAFFVSPVGDEDSPRQRRTDNLLEGLIRPELDSRNISVIRADRLPSAGSITEQAAGNLLNSDLVVCDLVGTHANIFYQLGVAEAFGTPCIILAGEEPLPFGGADARVIRIPDQDGAIDAFEIRDYRERFGTTVDRVLEAGYDPNTPVSRVAELVAALDKPTVDRGASDSPLVKRDDRYDHRQRWTRSRTSS